MWYVKLMVILVCVLVFSHVELRPTSSLATASLSVQPSSLQEGQDLSLTCSIEAHNLEERFFSVAWLKGDVELARIGPTGILSLGPQHRGRASDRDLRAARVATRDYRLTLQQVRTEDQGEFTCRVWPQERGQDGAFEQGEAQDSQPVLVTISATGQPTQPSPFQLSQFHLPVNVKLSDTFSSQRASSPWRWSAPSV